MIESFCTNQNLKEMIRKQGNWLRKITNNKDYENSPNISSKILHDREKIYMMDWRQNIDNYLKYKP